MADKSEKIVDIRAKLAGARQQEAARPLPPVIAALQEKSSLFLTERLTSLLDDVDDTLFELADEASSAKEQHLYFDSMREIRIHRQQVEQNFSQLFKKNFQSQIPGGQFAAESQGVAKLKLLESDALEELVAIEGMAKKAERRYLKELWQLSAAWQQSLGGDAVTATELPLGPAQIAKALGQACSELNIDLKARLVLFKLFDAQIISRFDELFAVLVPVLESQGLSLDALTQKPKPADKRVDGVKTENAQKASTDERVTQLIDELEALLTSNGSTQEAATLSKPSLMVALQDIQNEQFSHLKNRDAANDDGDAYQLVTQKLVSRLKQVGRVAPGDASALSVERDRDTIHLVGTLFQYMLEGDGLADPLKGLMAQLQIPILKMAMLDKSFFSREEHPARKLLSAIMSASIGWAPVAAPEKDPLYRKVEDVVLRVLGDFGVDTQVFVDVLSEFSKFQEKAQRRAELVAQRTVSAEGGRATAQAARGYIAGLLDEKLAGGNYPVAVERILKEGWSKVLFLSYVQAGPESPRFKDEVEFVDRLLWSVAANEDVGHRNELITALPVLVETLRLGFNRVSLNAFETGQWFEQLERLHMAKLNRKPKIPDDAPQQNAPSTADDVDLEDLDAALARELDEPMPHSLPVSGEAVTGKSQAAAASVDPSLLDSLRVGNWVDLRQDDGKMLRCRLAAVINGIGRYIFVNRAGIKVAEYNRDSLLEAVSDGHLLMIDDDRMFDRALESVISNLRDMDDKPLS